MEGPLQHIAGRARRWLWEEALPLWSERGLAADGGAVEALRPDASGPAEVGYRRVRVLARQLYVFSHAQELGWSPAAAVADRLMAFLIARARRGDGFWLRRLTPEGAPLDPTPDLYDQAFVLFALAWRHRASGDGRAASLARETFDLIEQYMAHPNGLGFHEELPPPHWRRQNPHMHLAEALVALAQATGEPRYQAGASALVHLFKHRMIAARFPALPELFQADWLPAPGAEGRRIEPGHMFEWAWILAEHQALTGETHRETIQALVEWAERYGVDPETGLVYSAVDDQGAPLERHSRIWPHTERIKGLIALAETSSVAVEPALRQAVCGVFDRFLGPAPAGGWCDAIDAAGVVAPSPLAASSFYHIHLAFTELIRFAEKVG